MAGIGDFGLDKTLRENLGVGKGLAQQSVQIMKDKTKAIADRVSGAMDAGRAAAPQPAAQPAATPPATPQPAVDESIRAARVQPSPALQTGVSGDHLKLTGAARSASHGMEAKAMNDPQVFEKMRGEARMAAEYGGRPAGPIGVQPTAAAPAPTGLRAPQTAPMGSGVTVEGKPHLKYVGPPQAPQQVGKPMEIVQSQQFVDENARVRAANNPHLATDAGQKAVGQAQQFRGSMPPRGPAVLTPAEVEAVARGAGGGGGGGGQPPVAGQPGAPGSGGLRGALRTAGSILRPVAAGAGAGVGAVTGVTEGLRPAQDFTTAMTGGYTDLGDQQSGVTSTETLRGELTGQPQGPGAVFRGLRGLGVPENAARLGDDVATRFAGFANRISGGVLDLFGNADSRGGERFSTQGVRAPERVVPPAAAKPATPEPAIPAVRGRSVTPVTADQVMNGADDKGRPYVPDRGTGAFQRTTRGNRGAASPMDTSARSILPQNRGIGPDGKLDIVKPGDSDYEDRAGPPMGRGSLRDGGVSAPRGRSTVGGRLMGDHVQSSLRLAGENMRGKAERQVAELGIKQQTADTAAAAQRTAQAKFGHEVRKDRAVEVKERVAHSAATDPEIAKITDPKAREVALANKTAEVSERMEYSLGRRNAGRGDLSPRAANDFFMAEKWRDAYHKSQGGVLNTLRDLLGDNRFDSKDSFSYLPAYRDKNGRIYSENGNHIGDNESYRQSNWFSPNRVDADMRRYVERLPSKEQYEAARKNKEK